jgi:hypothetical protein
MYMSTSPGELLSALAPAARRRYATDAGWAQASGVPKETLSRLKGQESCDLRTIDALARAAGYVLAVVPTGARESAQVPTTFSREDEDRLLDLCASGNADPAVWSRHGSGFFMGGLAVLLSSARGFDREKYLRLAEALHAGVSTPEVFGLWLRRSPVQPSRFLPMARVRKRPA